MAHRTVVRNEAYQPSSFHVRERHNERKNESYFNGDIEPERAYLNIHFRQSLSADGTPETYEKAFNRLLAEKKIVKHGTKADAKLFCEMVFDVNTSYFEDGGGYEYARKFFAEAYCLAVKEAGSEDYILSAVMHADERNKALSEQLGRDVYHYHLHVVYVPVVEKKLYFKKNNKDPELAGKLKEVIPQISQSGKWPLRVPVERGGKTITLNSYSLLQDRFFEHMRAAGFEGFERGERGSTAEHLEVLDYKIKQDTARAEAMAAAADEKAKEALALDGKADKKKKQLAKLDEQISVKTKAAATIDELDAIGKPALLGGYTLTADELKKLKTLAKKSVTADKRVADMRVRLDASTGELATVKAQLAAEIRSHPSITSQLTWFNKFMSAMKRAPKRLMSVIEEIMLRPPENGESERDSARKHKQEVR